MYSQTLSSNSFVLINWMDAGGTPFGTWEGGQFDYTDIENNYVDTNGYVRYWNEASKVPYVYNNDTKVFITYNDKESIMYTTSLLHWILRV